MDENSFILGKELRRAIAMSKAECRKRLNFVYEYSPEDAEGIFAKMEIDLAAVLGSLEDEAHYRLEEIVVNDSCSCCSL